MINLDKITCIEDLRVMAKKRVPKMFYDYADSGSWTESTYRENQSDFGKIKFRQRVGINLENRSVVTTVLGQEIKMPVIIAPTGLTGMQHADGEILAARAATQFGIPYTLSTVSICSIEDVSAGIGGKPFWFQLYVIKDKNFIGDLIDRAKAANCSALVLTMDLQIVGQRHKDIKNGLSVPPKITISNVLNIVTKIKWCMSMLATRQHKFGNIVGHVKGVNNITDVAKWINSQFDLTLSWKDVEWIKQRWGGKLILKGILDEEDAKLAIQHGADAIIVSNHGGRQLDGAPSAISVLPRIVEAVHDKVEIYMDGGIRSGQDVLKAIALGAKACFIGRAYLYGLGAAGGMGVTKALEIIYNELSTSMGFCGHTNIKNVDESILWN